MMFKFQTYYDLSTSASSVQVITVKIGGAELQKRCTHLLGAYKWYKFGRASVKLIPAATLPVDPQGMSYASDDPQTVDPRDQLNPGLCRVTNGEDVFTKMSSLTAEQQERMYRTSMLDPRWSKFMLQHGFFRSATPLLWSIAELHQDAYPGSNINFPYNTNSNHGNPLEAMDTGLLGGQQGPCGVQSVSPVSIVGGNDPHPIQPVITKFIRKEGISSDRALIQTGHKVRMQWLPTDMLQGVTGSDSVGEQYYSGINVCPTVPLMTIVLPKANKTLYYYRLYVTQSVFFSGPRQVSPSSDGVVCGFDNFLLGRAVQCRPHNSIVPFVNPNTYDSGDGA